MRFRAIDVMHPGLVALLDHRWRIGVRSRPTVVKLLQAGDCGPQTSVVALTHGDYIERMAISHNPGRQAWCFSRAVKGWPVLQKRTVPVRIFAMVNRMHDWPGVARTICRDLRYRGYGRLHHVRHRRAAADAADGSIGWRQVHAYGA